MQHGSQHGRLIVETGIDSGSAVGADDKAQAIDMGELLGGLFPPLLLIAAVLGSILTGAATPTEAAGVGAMIAFIMTLAYGKFTLKGLKSAVVNTAKTSSMVIIILVGAACFSSIFMGSGGGEVVKDFIYGIGFGKVDIT